MTIVAQTLVLGTFNEDKGRELAELLAPHGLRIQTLSEVDSPLLLGPGR